MKKTEIVNYLSEHPTFRRLTKGQLKDVADHAQEVTIPAAGLLLRQDGSADKFYIVLKGKVTVEIPALFGAPIPMQHLGPAEIVGWSWLFPPFKWHFDARAAVETTAIEFDGRTLRERCGDDTALGYALAISFGELMLARLNAARGKVMEMYGPEG